MKLKAIGIDIGTTTVCGIVIDTEKGNVLDVRTLANDAVIQGRSFEKLQDPDRILEVVQGMYHDFLDKFDDICSIGLTGQMHGILYTDNRGYAVSPLYTWQDESGNERLESGRRYVDQLSEETGYAMATGFGLSTFYYMTKQKSVPEAAVSICTIPDYIGMRLAQVEMPVITPSMAASLGCFDLKKLTFDKATIQEAGMNADYLPECQNGYVILGRTPEGISVAASIGDNQASFIGSVKDSKESVAFNVGTGSQVSAGIDHYIDARHVELRPLACEEYILAGSGLCGGRAYAALEKFFSMTVEAMTGENPGKLYNKMSDLMEQQKNCDSEKLVANTRFCGTRENPSLKGSIGNLTLDNFTPAAMVEAVLGGIAEELVTYHQQMMEQGVKEPTVLIGSGNGIRMNPWLKQIFEEIYHLPMQIPVHHEEAAFGAALYSLCAAGEKKSLDEARELIHYE